MELTIKQFNPQDIKKKKAPTKPRVGPKRAKTIMQPTEQYKSVDNIPCEATHVNIADSEPTFLKAYPSDDELAALFFDDETSNTEPALSTPVILEEKTTSSTVEYTTTPQVVDTTAMAVCTPAAVQAPQDVIGHGIDPAEDGIVGAVSEKRERSPRVAMSAKSACRSKKVRKRKHSTFKDESYEVERILESRIKRGHLQYRVKWVHYKSDQGWYDARHFKNCPQRLYEFHVADSSHPGPPKRFPTWTKCYFAYEDAKASVCREVYAVLSNQDNALVVE